MRENGSNRKSSSKNILRFYKHNYAAQLSFISLVGLKRNWEKHGLLGLIEQALHNGSSYL